MSKIHDKIFLNLNEIVENGFPVEIYCVLHDRNTRLLHDFSKFLLKSYCGEVKLTPFPIRHSFIDEYSARAEDLRGVEKLIDNYNILGIIDNEYLYLKNPVNNHEVPKFVIRSKFGLLLSTYHGKIISANKLSLFLSNDCVPLIVRNCDDESQLIPKELKDQIEIKDGECLKKIINDSSNYERLLLSCKKKFHKYQSRKYYEEHFKRLLS